MGRRAKLDRCHGWQNRDTLHSVISLFPVLLVVGAVIFCISARSASAEDIDLSDLRLNGDIPEDFEPLTSYWEYYPTRPANFYELVASHDDAVCNDMLAALNEPGPDMDEPILPEMYFVDYFARKTGHPGRVRDSSFYYKDIKVRSHWNLRRGIMLSVRFYLTSRNSLPLTPRYGVALNDVLMNPPGKRVLTWADVLGDFLHTGKPVWLQVSPNSLDGYVNHFVQLIEHNGSGYEESILNPAEDSDDPGLMKFSRTLTETNHW